MCSCTGYKKCGYHAERGRRIEQMRRENARRLAALNAEERGTTTTCPCCGSEVSR